MSAPIIGRKIKKYIKNFQLNFPIDCQKLKKNKLMIKNLCLNITKKIILFELFESISINDNFKLTEFFINLLVSNEVSLNYI